VRTVVTALSLHHPEFVKVLWSAVYRKEMFCPGKRLLRRHCALTKGNPLKDFALRGTCAVEHFFKYHVQNRSSQLIFNLSNWTSYPMGENKSLNGKTGLKQWHCTKFVLEFNHYYSPPCLFINICFCLVCYGSLISAMKWLKRIVCLEKRKEKLLLFHCNRVMNYEFHPLCDVCVWQAANICFAETTTFRMEQSFLL